MKTYAERLKWAREKIGINQSELARRVGQLVGSSIRPQTIQHLETPEKSVNGSSFTPAIAYVLGVSPIWLANGIGESIPNDLVQESDSVRFGRHKVPIVASAKLGDENSYFVELDYPVGSGDGYIIYPSKDPNAYALKCFGESMKPRIRHGEYVVIEPNHSISPGDEVLIKDLSGRVMIKVWNFTRDGLCHFSSINESFTPFSIPQEEIERMQFVSAIVKSSMKIEDF